MKQFRVQTDKETSFEYGTFEEAKKIFDDWKDSYMSEGVIQYESFVEIAESEDGFEDFKVIKKVIAVIDHDRHELGTPREEGCDFDYWAKWLEVDEQV